MGQYISFDVHKHYTLATAERTEGGMAREEKLLHERGVFRRFLACCEVGSPVAVETVGNWYWVIDEIEESKFKPQLVHARKAKLMMGMINKTDHLDNTGMNQLQRNHTLPTVWIPPKELRDQRELPRTRMAMTGMRTMLKNRIHAALAKYAIQIDGVSDTFGVRGRRMLEERLSELPCETRRTVEGELTLLDDVEDQIQELEERIEEVIAETPEMRLLKTIPGVGNILAALMVLEIGDVERFGGSDRLASYSGTVPRVHSSGGKTFYGRVRPDVNRYLKWAFVEAANVVVMNQRRHPQIHVMQLYRRIRQRKGHAKAVVAMARHLAEAAYWVLKKKEPYRERVPKQMQVSSTHG